MAIRKPLVASLCGTFLKPEMLSVYRQVTGLRRHRTVVFTEKRLNEEQFPFEQVVVLQRPSRAVRLKQRKKRQRGNFIKRFYYKHLLKQWPPPQKPLPIAPPPPPTYDDEAYDLCDRLREHKPELAHVYYGHKAVKYLPMIRRWGGPIVVSFHGIDITESVYKPNNPTTLAEVFQYASLVLARSRSLMEQLAAMGCPSGKLRLNRTPVPLSRIPRTIRTPPPEGAWQLLQACRLIAKKGLKTTLGAMRQVVDVWPRARLVIAGDGPLLSEMRSLTEELGLVSNVEFTGWQPQGALLELYTQSHLFLHPSETTATGDREGIPNSLLEAMASGLPAVATEHGGIPEAVSNGLNGLLTPEKSPEQFGAAILTLLNDPSLLTAMSRSAAESMDAYFGAAEQIERLEDCYEEALNMAQR